MSISTTVALNAASWVLIGTAPVFVQNTDTDEVLIAVAASIPAVDYAGDITLSTDGQPSIFIGDPFTGNVYGKTAAGSAKVGVVK